MYLVMTEFSLFCISQRVAVVDYYLGLLSQDQSLILTWSWDSWFHVSLFHDNSFPYFMEHVIGLCYYLASRKRVSSEQSYNVREGEKELVTFKRTTTILEVYDNLIPQSDKIINQ